MRQIVGKAYTELGKELYEAQQELAKQGSKYEGVFERWYTHLGWKKRTVYNLIDRYNLVQNLHEVSEVERIEDLPVSLTYEIAKPSAESTPEKAQAKAEVLAGDIATLKEYRERIKELEKKAEAERKERERLEVENEKLSNREPEVRVEYERIEVETIPDDYEEAKRRLEEYKEKFGDISNYDEHVTATHRQDMLVAVMSFSQGVREFIKRYDYMTKYKSIIDNLDESSRNQYNEAVKALKDMAEGFEYTSGSADIVIDASFSGSNIRRKYLLLSRYITRLISTKKNFVYNDIPVFIFISGNIFIFGISG